MTILVVPSLESEPWPSLGDQVCSFIETYLVHGPGDLRGERVKLDEEKRALIWRMYEVFPQGHPNEGRRRFRRCTISLRKGTAKTELAAWIAACELHPDGPVRCDGFDAAGRPVGRGVTDPYLAMVAYTEEQTEDLAYAALKAILEMSPLAEDFDIGLQRIMRILGDGKCQALAAAPDARDGARTTWEHFDETHRFTLPRLKEAHRVMLANLPKRRLADPWALETTTAYSTGENSVGEATMTYARQIASGEIATQETSRLFFFHRQASEEKPLTTPEEIRDAVVEASGPFVAEWSDIDGIVEQFLEPTADIPLLRRLWLNQPVSGGGKAFPADRWQELQRDFSVTNGDLITLGFDGARFHDATALVATHVETGFQWPIGIWKPPVDAPQTADAWQIDPGSVTEALSTAFERWTVVRFYADPYWWESEIASWQGRWGDKIVQDWRTNRPQTMAFALRGYHTAMVSGEVTHDGDPEFAAHIANAVRQDTTVRDPDTGERMWLIRKERANSPFKIDAAMAGCLSWEARQDAIADGVLNAEPKSGISIYVPGDEDGYWSGGDE